MRYPDHNNPTGFLDVIAPDAPAAAIAPSPAYTIDDCIEILLARGDAEEWTGVEPSILHHLRAAKAAASREAEIRAEAWDEGYSVGFVRGYSPSLMRGNAVNPHRIKP